MRGRGRKQGKAGGGREKENASDSEKDGQIEVIKMWLKGNTNVHRDERRLLVSCLNHYTSIGLTRALS